MSDEDKCCDVCGQWHQSHDDLICTLYSYLEQKDARIKELEEREKKLIQCVRFYADKENWDCEHSREFCEIIYFLLKDTNGELARETLKELGINNE